ncbi:hypothetical protein K491DRAFT_681263 [Lophiostoma macrostomum CBS 122681]|uniref:Uncharacterized protein n=1 Tax=Lophiostoma macrostomum CBS 122681 TaxID=1314788 RepID=A0A6A6SY67_9PLEO|nr:hypothetical protein K491DRAFT_681263 [Lophiostoma macrostomum CBS 122681]
MALFTKLCPSSACSRGSLSIPSSGYVSNILINGDAPEKLYILPHSTNMVKSDVIVIKILSVITQTTCIVVVIVAAIFPGCLSTSLPPESCREAEDWGEVGSSLEAVRYSDTSRRWTREEKKVYSRTSEDICGGTEEVVRKQV